MENTRWLCVNFSRFHFGQRFGTESRDGEWPVVYLCEQFSLARLMLICIDISGVNDLREEIWRASLKTCPVVKLARS